MPAIKDNFGKSVAFVCTVAACIVTAAVLAQPQPLRPFDAPDGAENPTWGGVHDGTSLYMTTHENVAIAALGADGSMLKAEQSGDNVYVVDGVAATTLIQITRDVYGVSTVELSLPSENEVWVAITFDERGNPIVGLSGVDNYLASAAGAPPAERALQDCGDCDTPHPTPGCSDPVCEAIVCAADPPCCSVEWDGTCAGEAMTVCDCGGGGGPCGTCTPTINDGQVGITGTINQQCEDGQWQSLAFPIQTGGGTFDTVLSVHNTNTGAGDMYAMGGTCDGCVTVCVPHDQSGDPCVDGGALYDSTEDIGCAGGGPGWGH